MSVRQTFARRPLLVGLLFQGMLIPLALGLALLFGLAPWSGLDFSVRAVATGILGTLPPLVGIWWLSRLNLPSWRKLEILVRDLVVRLFARARTGAVAATAMLAGVSEELLFRGVLQVGLTELMTPFWGILIAAVLFGLAHYVNTLYFLVATAMGLYLGAVYHLTGNLLVVILIHALYDWIAIRAYLPGARASGR